MTPKQEWGAFSVIFVLMVLVATAVVIQYGYDPFLAVAFASVALVMFAYVIYKRYHVEVVPESDILLFDEPEDLRILSGIYGLDTEGDENTLRNRLVNFARQNKDKAFVWIAPRAVSSVASSFEIVHAAPKAAKSAGVQGILQRVIAEPDATTAGSSRLTGGRPRSGIRLSGITQCPICDAAAPKEGVVCDECGADLEFYVVLAESKVGRMLISEKADASRRKPR
ncbi:MAG TPA: hypothetical protein VGB78_06455 [Thermoplasmata archaeon]|jgi:hypothetical protein